MFNESGYTGDIRQVAVIGSGIAGLSAGLRLQAQNVAVTLFEKSRGPGGRLSSKRLPESAAGGGSADIGAQYFTLRNPAFRKLLNQYAGATTYSQWPARLQYQKADGQWEPFRQDERFVGVPRMTAITRALSRSLNIKTGMRIESLARAADERWRLKDTEGGDQGVFDAVIITAPPAQARELLLNSGLTTQANSISGDVARMQACWAVVVHFEQSLGLDYDGFQARSDILQWAANNSSKPDRSGSGEWWVLHGHPDWSDDHRDAAPEFVQAALLKAFLKTVGLQRIADAALAHRWLYAKSSATSGPGHLWFDSERIGLIGDWLHGGRVEGAFESAESLLACWHSEGLLGPE